MLYDHVIACIDRGIEGHPFTFLRHPTSARVAFQTGQNLKTIVNESFAVINKCIEQFDTFRDLIRDELLQRTRFAGMQVRPGAKRKD
jgi:hypothetical protein